MSAASVGRPAATVFVLATIVLDRLALGVIIPVLPGLIEELSGGGVAGAARIFGLFGMGWALMQFIWGPVMGLLSDRFGRRPVVLISCLGLGLDYVLMALAPSLAWLLVGRLVSGVCAANVSAAQAYIADVTPPERRAGAYGMIGAASGIGFVLGPAVGGLLGAGDPRLPFWVAAALCFANFSYGLFVLPESLPRERRVPFLWRRAVPSAAFDLLRAQPGLLRLAIVYLLNTLAHAVLPSTYVLYVGYRYGWGEGTTGLTLALVGAASFVVQGWLVRVVAKRIGDRPCMLWGFAFGASGFLMMALAPNGGLFMAAVPFLALWGLAGPSLMASMTARVGADQQGRLQGVATSLGGVALLIGPGLFPWTFAAAIELGLPTALIGLPFLVAGMMTIAALVMALRSSAPPVAAVMPA